MKHINKFISAILIISLLTALVPGVSMAAANEGPTLIYLDQNFEEQTVGEAPWEFYQTEDTALGDFVIAELPKGDNENNKAILLKNAGKDGRDLRHFTAYNPIRHKFVFGFDFYLTNPEIKNTITLFLNEYRGKSLHLQESRELKFISLGNNLEVGSGAIKGVKLEANKWYSLMLEIDVSEGKANVYLDGELKATRVSLGKFKWFGGITINAPIEDGDFYLDDFVLYKSDKIMSEEEYSSALKLWQESPLYSGGKYAQGRHKQFDKLVWYTIYGHRLTKLETRWVWDKDKFLELNAPIKNTDDGVKVPLRSFGEMFGATTQWSEEHNKAIFSLNGESLEFFEGSNTYYQSGTMKKMPFPAEIIDGSLYVYIETLKDIIDFTYVIEGQLLFFDKRIEVAPEFVPYEPLDEAVLQWEQTYNLDDEIIRRLEAIMTYQAPTPEQILADYRATFPDGAHPKVHTSDFEEFKAGMDKDPQFKKVVEELVKRGDTTINAGIVKYISDSDNRGNPNTASMCGALSSVAFSYAITEDEKYKSFLLEQLNEIAYGGTNFRAGQFLGVGGAAYELGCAYSWMYNYLTETERENFSEIIYNLLLYAQQSYTCPLYNAYTALHADAGNQNLIINTGIITAAVAVIDEYPELCSEIISNALKAQSHFYPSYAPDGTCYEGLSYWLYTVGYMMPFFQIINTAFGTDYGITDSPGLTNMHNYAMSTTGSTAGFNVGDASPQSPMHSIFMWIGEKTGNMGLVNYRKSAMSASFADAFGWVFDSGTETLSKDSFEGDTYFDTIGSITMRTGWSKADTAIYFHGGANNDGHGHRDTGSFLFDMSGERWGDELEKASYDISYREENKDYKGGYYRNEGEGHNMVIANLSRENTYGVNPHAKAYVETVEFGDLESYAIMDLTETNELYKYGMRAVKLDKLKNEIVIQDDFKAVRPTYFWWFMNLKNAEIDISEDGQSAILTKNGKKIQALLHTEGGEKFQVLDPVPLPQYDHLKAPYDEPNEGYLRLAIHNPDTDRFHVTVTFRPLTDAGEPLAEASEYSYMSGWQTKTSKRAKLNSVTVDGLALEDFNPDVYGYDIEVMTEKDPMPVIELAAPDGYDVVVDKATTIPGITTVSLKREGRLEGMYSFSITPLNDTRRFINEKQIPIKSFSVSSEPEAQNPGSHLFDGTLDTKYATNETGGAVYIDYGQVRRVADIMMAFQYTDRYVKVKIEHSLDGVNYETVFEGQSPEMTNQLQSFDVGIFEARYLKVSFYGTSLGSSWTSVTELCSFEE